MYLARFLPAVLATATLGLALVPQPARADEAVDPTASLSVTSPATFESSQNGTLTYTYTCTADYQPFGVADFLTRVTQIADNGAVQGGNGLEDFLPCTGQPETKVMNYEQSAGPGFVTGPALVVASFNGAKLSQTIDIVVEGPPAPAPPPPPAPPTPPPAPNPKAEVSLQANASPEKVKKGNKITITGSIRRSGKTYKASTVLQFAPDHHGYGNVKTVKSSSGGALRTRVTATKSGSFRYTFAGNKTTNSARSAGDHIIVKAAKPKGNSTPGCVTRTEYKKAKTGMTKAKVASIFGTNGRRDARAEYDGFVSEVRSYKTCQKYSAVSISYDADPGESLRLSGKSAVWID